MMSVKNLSYVYKNDSTNFIKAVDDVNFCVQSGEALGIVGKTGSGKSTLACMLNGLLKPTEGNIFLNGKDIHKDFKNSQEVYFKIGLVFQYPEHQLFQKTAFDDIAFGLRNQGMNEEKIKLAVSETAEILGLTENILNSSPLVLSGGEKRKCAIAGIIALKPDVLILDEPTAGMDFRARKDLIKFLKKYCEKEKNSVIFISHVMEEVVEVCNKILVMNEGKTFLYADAKEIFKQKEKLEKISLKVPQVSEIMQLIKNQGYNVNESILTTNEAKKEILKLLKKGGDI